MDMARLVTESPLFPQVTPNNIDGMIAWASVLAAQVQRYLQEHAWRLNRSYQKDGTEAMVAPAPLQSVVVADLPTASEWEGAIIYVSDGSAGTRFRGSDGTSWVSLG